jgi:hypothetical protein
VALVSDLLLHGRLIGRLKRQIRKCDEKGITPQRRRKVLKTIHALILLERRMADPLDPDREVTWEQLRERITLMAPGAGLEVVS